MAATHALIVAVFVALACFQVGSGDESSSLWAKAEAALNATWTGVTTAVQRVEKGLLDGANAALAEAKAAAAATGATAECAGTALADASAAYAALPAAFTGCLGAARTAFTYYAQNLATDARLAASALEEGARQQSACGLLDAGCRWASFTNATKAVTSAQADAAFQLANAASASVNLVASVTTCDQQAAAQATLAAGQALAAVRNCGASGTASG